MLSLVYSCHHTNHNFFGIVKVSTKSSSYKFVISMSVIAPLALSVLRIPVPELLSTEALKGIIDAAISIEAATDYTGE